MKKIKVLFLILLVFSLQLSVAAWAANVKVKGRQLFVDGQPFVVKGVNYGYTPVGQGYMRYDWTIHPEIYRRDFALIKAMGANAIRIYFTSFLAEGLKEVLDAASEYGLYVILSIEVSWADDLSTTAARQKVLEEVKRVVLLWKNHPALLMWVVGLEINFFNVGRGYTIQPSAWYSLLNESARLAHELEGVNYHPVTTAEAEIANIGLSAYASDDASMPDLDLWGTDIYRGSGMYSVFSEYSAKSAKPMVILEFGCDALDSRTNTENQAEQALSFESQWNDIDNNLSVGNQAKVCAGVVIFQWADDWSKVQWGNPNPVHDTTPIANWVADGYYDNAAGNNINEEWWGIVAISSGTDEKTLRTGYYTWQRLWGQNMIGGFSSSHSLQTDITNYPNPFKPGETKTTIAFSVAPQTNVTVKIYDLIGNLVKVLKEEKAGDNYTEYMITWDGRDDTDKVVANGVYICYVIASSPNSTEVKYRKILALK